MIAQRLVGALCPYCKKKKENISQDIINIFEKELLSIPEETKKELDFSFGELYDAVGCKKCNWRGYKGRIGLFEVFEMTEELSALTISSNLSEELLIAEARRQGMITIRQDGLIKALKGKTSVEEVLRVGEEM
jgi:type II secretory ATPase GspE/PulE/Tfp pilus assembly ATPase PilB-like protein